jgi:ribosomal-protein-alanine N-acetyltransferase
VEFQIRAANIKDAGNISQFLSTQSYIYRHLDWRTPQDWLGFQPFLLLEDQNNLAGIMACPPEPPGISWVRLFSANPRFNIPKIWAVLFKKTTDILEHSGYSRLVALGMQKWFEDLLIQSQFTTRQSIVVLEWDESLPPQRSLPPDFIIRPMTVMDLSAVQHLDELAFNPIWQHSVDALVLALAQSSISTVVEANHKVVAYQMSTSYASSGHLARLAVDPQVQRQSIGYGLVRHLLLELKKRGVWRVTVNTQDDNFASLSLYKKLGFDLTGEEFKVFEYAMSGQSQ